MKLDDVSRGSVYVDTNILYMYLRVDPAHLATVKLFLNRIVHGEIDAFVSIPVLDELFYRLLLARIKDTTGRNPIEVLRENQADSVAAHSDMIDASLRKLTLLPHINLVGVETTDYDRMLQNIRTYSLLPRDALHVAIVQRLSLHLQPVFKGCRTVGGAVSEDLFAQGLCLPSGTQLTEEDLDRIANVITRCRKDRG